MRSLELPAAGETFPFDVPLPRGMRDLAFDAPVTILVGENGTGKSTLLEALAWAAEVPAAGIVERSDADAALAHVAPLADAMRLARERKMRRGPFPRAEGFFGYAKAQNAVSGSSAPRPPASGGACPVRRAGRARRGCADRAP